MQGGLPPPRAGSGLISRAPGPGRAGSSRCPSTLVQERPGPPRLHRQEPGGRRSRHNLTLRELALGAGEDAIDAKQPDVPR